MSSATRPRTCHERGERWTHLTGLESQICLLGGCLLMTYVPLSPSLRVNTPDLPHMDVLHSVSPCSSLVERGEGERGTHRVLHVGAGQVEVLELLLEVLGEAVHGLVREVVVLSLGEVAARGRGGSAQVEREGEEGERGRTRSCTAVRGLDDSVEWSRSIGKASRTGQVGLLVREG